MSSTMIVPQFQNKSISEVAASTNTIKKEAIHRAHFYAAPQSPPPIEDVHIPSNFPSRTVLRSTRLKRPNVSNNAQRTRSSRLFLVLIHLVGVSTNVPAKRGNSSSISSKGSTIMSSMFSFHRPSFVGANPVAILLERLQIETSRKGLSGIVERVERAWGWNADEDLLGEPYWFQDNTDGQCLGPSGGFSDCGDATLWRVRRRPLTKKQLREKRYRLRHKKRLEERQLKMDRTTKQKSSNIIPSSVCVWPFFCEKNSQFSQPTNYGIDEVFGYEYELDDEVEGFALQLTDLDAAAANSSLFVGTMRKKRRLFWNTNSIDKIDLQDECLLSYDAEKDQKPAMKLGPCLSEEAWVWHVNRDGILVRGLTKSEIRKRNRRWRLFAGKAATVDRLNLSTNLGCVHRNSTIASLLPCNLDAKNRVGTSADSIVEFSLVRYPSTASKAHHQSNAAVTNEVNDSSSWEPWKTLDGASMLSPGGNVQTSTSNNEEKLADHLPRSRTTSQNAKNRKVEVKSTASMLHASLDPVRSPKYEATSASHIRDAPIAMNGVAFHEQRGTHDNVNTEGSTTPHTIKPQLQKASTLRADDRKSKSTLLHKLPHNTAPGERSDDHDSNPHRPRKIPIHPYIQSSKDFVWIDPLTSLEYPTDLCTYLGQNKKEAGRHTLMGVGQYYRTAFNIKVYGAALYVSKRDVLAAQKFGEYAALTAEELRNRDDFYDLLMSMPSSDEDEATSAGALFDRTLFIKINMQLSTDAMRKSLEADWSLLTDEMKSLIIESSFEERMADDRMLQKINSKENSSNCSCGQTAPPEYNADPSCCARGTELVFTWRKNGDFEVRLDGRVMDIFPRPDIAKGIFAEYLNKNPISLDAKAHFTDGFPFLLAPLAQVKGMSSAVPPSQIPKKVESQSSNPMNRFLDIAMNSFSTVNAQASSFSKWMQGNAADVSSNMGNAFGTVVGAARGLGSELDRQRMEFFEIAMAFKEEGMDIISSLSSLMKTSTIEESPPSLSPFSPEFDVYNEDSASQEIVPDEIGIEIEPSMNFSHSLFFVSVHVYLMLLFVVSFPASYQSKLIVKRKMVAARKLVDFQSNGHNVFVMQ
eukprot:scaffold274_cov144-Skeletonema_menzelii.AAC.3